MKNNHKSILLVKKFSVENNNVSILPSFTLFSVLAISSDLFWKTPAPLVTQTCWNKSLALGEAVSAVTRVAPDPLAKMVTFEGCPPKLKWMWVLLYHFFRKVSINL